MAWWLVAIPLWCGLSAIATAAIVLLARRGSREGRRRVDVGRPAGPRLRTRVADPLAGGRRGTAARPPAARRHRRRP